MAGPAPIFRELHQLRRFAHGLQEQLNRIPIQLKAHQTKLAKQEQGLHDAQEAVKRLKVTANDKEKALKSLHEKIARFEKQLNEVSAKKEYDALQMEIAHAKLEGTHLEDEILNNLMESEERTAKLPEVEKNVKQVREDVAKIVAESSPRKASLEAQLAETLTKLKSVESTIPPDLVPQYRRTIVSLGAEAMSAVHNRICETCRTEITGQTFNELKQDLFVTCQSCGRILYLPEPTASVEE